MEPAPSKTLAWVRIARLQFYPMVAIMYGAGAAAARVHTGHFDWTLCLLTYLCLFLIELATVMTNEYFDYASDVENRNAGPFTGGSRMLVVGALSFAEVRRAVVTATVALVVVTAGIVAVAPDGRGGLIAALLALGLVLGIGYTAPPLRLSYRGLGEIDVAFTHSIYVLALGYVAQTGAWNDPLPYLLALPAFFAVLSANTLAGIPDRSADLTVGKRSYSVVFGARSAAVIAMTAALAAALAGVWLWASGTVDGRIGLAFFATVPHALALVAALVRFVRSGSHDRRIDPIMINALNFIVWFGLIPLVYYLWHARSLS